MSRLHESIGEVLQVWTLYLIMPWVWTVVSLLQYWLFAFWRRVSPKTAPSWIKTEDQAKGYQDYKLASVFYMFNAELVPMVANTLSAFACSTLISSEGRLFLSSDPSIPCFEGARHWQLVAVASLAVLIYMVLVPLGLAWKLLATGTLAVRNSDKRFKTLFGFLFARFEVRRPHGVSCAGTGGVYVFDHACYYSLCN